MAGRITRDKWWAWHVSCYDFFSYVFHLSFHLTMLLLQFFFFTTYTCLLHVGPLLHVFIMFLLWSFHSTFHCHVFTYTCSLFTFRRMYFIHATYMLLTYLSITSHASMAREFHGFRNPQGLWVGYTGVRVWVANFVPSQNPYPQDEGMGFGGFFHGFLKPRLRLLFWIFPLLL